MFSTQRRHGGFVIFEDANGLRHAVRLGAILGVHEVDSTEGEGVLVSMSGGRIARVDADLEECLDALDMAGRR